MPQQFEQADLSAQERTSGQDMEQDRPVAAAMDEGSFDALDAVLDDIESVLESNAEEYVASFVQKGGE